MTIKNSTVLAYLKRARQLREKGRSEIGVRSLSDELFVDWLIHHHRIGLAPATWLLYRRACCFELTRLARRSPYAHRKFTPLAERLEATQADPKGAPEERTSAKKAKKLGEDDFDKIIAAGNLGRSRNVANLENWLISTLISGLRPCEWANAQFREPLAGRAPYVLHVRCAKHSPERASETRTLEYDELPARCLQALRDWTACVREARQAGTYATLISTLSRLMRRIALKLFARRAKRPCPYSARHEALAGFKAAYIEIHEDAESRMRGAAMVATLAGHISDLSATRHYARAGKGKPKWPVPRPLAREVASVRRRLGPRREKFEAFLVACSNVQRPK